MSREAHGGPRSFDFSEWLPPDYKTHYAARAVRELRLPGDSAKPLLILHNKVCHLAMRLCNDRCPTQMQLMNQPSGSTGPTMQPGQ